MTDEMIKHARNQRIRSELSKLISEYGYECVVAVVREEIYSENTVSKFEEERIKHLISDD